MAEETSRNPLRHITIFVVPAGTPNSSSAGKGPWYLGQFLGLSTPVVKHWGLYVDTKANFQDRQGLCVELDRAPNGDIVVSHRTRQEREDMEPQEGIKYQATNIFTRRSDADIIRTAERICAGRLGHYRVIGKNCQTLVNEILSSMYNDYSTGDTFYFNIEDYYEARAHYFVPFRDVDRSLRDFARGMLDNLLAYPNASHRDNVTVNPHGIRPATWLNGAPESRALLLTDKYPQVAWPGARAWWDKR